VTQSIESIASVSEENSAAIEEVSASAEEMTAQVEEVTASAQSLAEMAKTLQQTVAQFKFQEKVSVDEGQENPESGNEEHAYFGPDRRKSLAEYISQDIPGYGQKATVMN
jgi:ABC-type transporter Mla subunit MlaD